MVMPKIRTITGEKDGVRVIDDGDALVLTIGDWFAQTGETDASRVRFEQGDEAWVTEEHAHHLAAGKAVKIQKLPLEDLATKPERARKPHKQTTKAMKPKENK